MADEKPPVDPNAPNLYLTPGENNANNPGGLENAAPTYVDSIMAPENPTWHGNVTIDSWHALGPDNPYLESDQSRIAKQQAEKRAERQAAAADAAAQRAWDRKLATRIQVFNPPPIGYATGAPMYIPNAPLAGIRRDGVIIAGDVGTEDRGKVLGSEAKFTRVSRKGNLTPDLTYPGDWDVDESEGAENTPKDVSVFEKRGGRIVTYGFRFMYNPASLDFGVSPTSGINLGYIMSAKDSAMPLGAVSGGGSLSIQFPISRVDDLQAIHYDPVRKRWKSRGYFWGTDPETRQGLIKGADLEGIATKGTMYDLEFLFRTTLGKSWNTVYRNETSDIGLIFSAPLRLQLSPTMVYRVRVDSVSYSHRSFTPDMVPIYTEVSISLSRIPDVVNPNAGNGATSSNAMLPSGTSSSAYLNSNKIIPWWA